MTTKTMWVRRTAAAVGTLSVAGALVFAFAPISSAAVPIAGGPIGGAPVAAATASAGTGRNLPAAKAAVDARIKLRLATLSALKIAITGATDLTSSDKSTLTGIVSGDVSGLTALQRKVDGETTVAAVKTDGRAMIVDYRVYMLVVPKVRFNIASDKETTNIAKLKSAHDKLAKLATQLAGQGKDTSAVQAKLDDLSTKLDAATSALGTKAATLLGVAPSADPAAMKAAVAPVRAAVKAARADLKAALADAKAARNGLKTLS